MATPELLGPVEVLGHPLDDRREARQQHQNAGVELLLAQGLAQLLVAQALAGSDHPVGLDHLQRVGRGDQHLGEKGVGIERDRRDQLVELRVGQELLLRQRRLVLGRHRVAGQRLDERLEVLAGLVLRRRRRRLDRLVLRHGRRRQGRGHRDKREQRHGILQLQHRPMPSGKLGTRQRAPAGASSRARAGPKPRQLPSGRLPGAWRRSWVRPNGIPRAESLQWHSAPPRQFVTAASRCRSQGLPWARPRPASVCWSRR